MVVWEIIIGLVAKRLTKSLCNEAVNQVWHKYDANGNGALEKDEVRTMIMDILETFRQEERFDEDTFSRAFDAVDHDGDGDIERKQM